MVVGRATVVHGITWAGSEGEALSVVRKALAGGWDINRPDPIPADAEGLRSNGDWPPLHACVNANYPQVAGLLIEKGANINEQTSWGATALYVAARQGRTVLAKLLIEADCDLNKPEAAGETPLYIASSNGHDKVVDLLLDANANVNVPESNGTTPLYAAASMGHAGITHALLYHGADADKPPRTGKTSIHMAAARGHMECVEHLLEACADINFRCLEGITPLIAATDAGNRHVVSALVKVLKIDLNARDNEGRTAVYTAAARGHDVIMESLLRAGADATIAANDRSTPMYVARRGGFDLCCQHLRAAGAGTGVPTWAYATVTATAVLGFGPFVAGAAAVGAVFFALPAAVYFGMKRYDAGKTLAAQPHQSRRPSQSISRRASMSGAGAGSRRGSRLENGGKAGTAAASDTDNFSPMQVQSTDFFDELEGPVTGAR